MEREKKSEGSKIFKFHLFSILSASRNAQRKREERVRERELKERVYSLFDVFVCALVEN